MYLLAFFLELAFGDLECDGEVGGLAVGVALGGPNKVVALGKSVCWVVRSPFDDCFVFFSSASVGSAP